MEKRNVIIGNPIRQDKYVIGSKGELRNVYKVSIKNLYYNDENGRIASFMSRYNSEHTEPISNLDFDEYNDVLMNFIIKSESKEQYKTTKENIRQVGQLEPGIILTDGRVIDGNRRFTCLRDLYAEYHSEQFLYFECFVLDVPKTREERASLKALELSAQYGTETRVSYNPVDRLADVYKDLVGPDKLFTPEEYSARLNNLTKVSEVKNLMLEAETLWDYLEFTNNVGRWDIARDFKLEGPIHELAMLRKKVGPDEWDSIASVFYTQMMHISGDRSREIRKIVNIYKNEPSKFQEISDKVFAAEVKSHKVDTIVDTNLKKEKAVELQRAYIDIDQTINRAATEVGINKAKNKQLKTLEDVSAKLNQIDKTAIRLSTEDMLSELENELTSIEDKIRKIREVILSVKQS